MGLFNEDKTPYGMSYKSMNKISKIVKLAKKCGWNCIMRKPENALLRFKKDGTAIDVWWTKMTVGLMPDDEEKTYYMYDLSMDDLFELFMSPLSYKHEGGVKITKRYSKK